MGRDREWAKDAWGADVVRPWRANVQRQNLIASHNHLLDGRGDAQPTARICFRNKDVQHPPHRLTLLGILTRRTCTFL